MADEQQTILTAKKQLFTYITVLLDRSGSMGRIKDDTVGGFSAFLNEQKKVKGKARWGGQIRAFFKYRSKIFPHQIIDNVYNKPW